MKVTCDHYQGQCLTFLVCARDQQSAIDRRAMHRDPGYRDSDAETAPSQSETPAAESTDALDTGLTTRRKRC